MKKPFKGEQNYPDEPIVSSREARRSFEGGCPEPADIDQKTESINEADIR
jgi:hypothetical protein